MPPSQPPDRFAALVRLVDRLGPQLLAQHEAPGVQAAVVIGGRLVVARAWGVADRSKATPLRDDHVFKACSNAKPLAAVIALSLCERGLLDLDEPIWRWVRSWMLPADRCGGHDPQRITLRRLLSHQSGLSLRGFPQVDWATTDPPGARQLLDGCFGDALTPRLTNQPGTRVVYGGDSTTLVQLAIEEVTGRSIQGLFDELIASPLGLRSIWLGRREDRVDRIVACHLEDGRTEAPRFYPALAASGLYTTATDLALAYAGVPRLLRPALARQAVSPQAIGDNGWAFGLGFAVAESNGRRVYKHAGWSESVWGAAEGVAFRAAPESNSPDADWPRAAAAVLCNSACGKEVCLPLLGAMTQWITSRGV